MLATFWITKNTLFNSCKLTRWSVLYSESSCIQTVFKSKHVTDQKLLEDVHKDSLHIPSQINRFLCNRPDEPLKASGHPVVSSKNYVEDVRTTEQHSPDAGSIIIQHGIRFQKSTLLGSLYKSSRRCGNTSRRYPAFQNILVFHSNAERSYSEDRQDARPSRLDVDLIRIELRYF
jgi:hypothetical protein